jgi:hypothetical protein
MRHIILFPLAAVTAYWLAPHALALSQKQRYIETAVVIAVFFAVNFAAGQARKGRKPASRNTSPLAAPARRK